MLRTRTPAPPAAPRRRFSHPGWTWASGLLVCAVAAAFAFLLLHDRTPEQAPPAAAPSTAPSTAPRGDVAPRPVGGRELTACPSDLPAEDQSLPTRAQPPAAQWLPVGRMVAPFAPQVGPVLTDGGVHRCYARTPTGALFAAAGFVAGLTDPEHLTEAVADLTAPGPGRDALLELAETNPVAITGSGQAGEIVGFTYLSTGMSTVAVALVIEAPNGGRVAAPITLTWAGDWQVVLPPDGELTALASPITSLDGYVPFRAS